MSTALAGLRIFSGSPFVQRQGWLKPAERVAATASQQGFAAASAIARGLASRGRGESPERLANRPRAELFDLNVSEEELMVRETAQRFARDVLRPAAHEADTKCAPPAEFGGALADLALGPMAIPESFGGAASESTSVTSALIAEDLAWGDAGQALAALAPIAVASALVRWGSSAQQAAYLPAFAEETPPRASFAVSEPRALFDPAELRTRAAARGNRYVLHGEKSLVVGAEAADYFLVTAELLGHGPQLFIVARSEAGVSASREPALGARAAGFGRVRFDGVELDASALVGEAAGAVDYEELIARNRVAVSSLMVGVGQAVLDYVTPYVNDRVAFGEPISNRQSVAFMVANLAIEIDAMRMVTWRAAARLERGMNAKREAYLAHLLATEKGLELASSGVQLLGGHGYTKEHPVERFYRDLMALSTVYGGALV
ncbi:MAG: acyl-CoA dehydrogenase family protein [Sorangiineae bacterium]|nr:acyl-CoA dehydrogenase family protein [Polyangiaceae bacterium]MEB2323677.1 acyl-CoA dehydrogenase family protein [Sorangiineae bacterium]